MHKDNFDKGIDIGITENPLGFIYGKDVFGPTVENRRLDDIRSSLLDPKCEGPDIVYSIAMDVGKTVHKALLQKQHLLFWSSGLCQRKFGNGTHSQSGTYS